MKKTKPNKLTECQKQIGSFEVEVPTEINEHESRFYHLALVEQVHRPKLMKYDTRLTIIKMNQTDYITKIQGASTKGSNVNAMALLGYTNLFILHDPTFKAPAKKKPAVKKPAQPKAE
tara:strand:- start:1782 stop:2135 length:354 start_codon:yes stop_codon:yes gene_type:complete